MHEFASAGGELVIHVATYLKSPQGFNKANKNKSGEK